MRKLLFLICLFGASAPRYAQERVFKGVLAVSGARIEVGDGKVIEKGNVVIRDGIIEAVGADLRIPPEAEVIKGEGLVVYPGFIDAYLTRGLKLPDPQPDQDSRPDESVEAPAFMREANRRGIRAEIKAADYLAFTEPELAALRKAGFTSAVVAPTGGFINGSASLVNLTGLPRRESVLNDSVGMCFALRTVGFGFGGGYPNSLMGIMAHVRQTLLDAKRHSSLRGAFLSGSPQRPASDGVLDSLYTTTNGTSLSIMEADTDLEIHRSLGLAQEFGLRPIICGGLDAWKRADSLVKDKVVVIAGLNFGQDPAKATGQDDSPSAVKEDHKRLWSEKVSNLKRLNDAGVWVTLSDRGLQKPEEFWENLRLAIKAGYPRDAALKALTSHASTMLMLDSHLGALDPGKIANLTIMNGDFADEKTKTRFVIIDGKKFEVEDAPAGPPAPGGRRRGRPMEDEEAKGSVK